MNKQKQVNYKKTLVRNTEKPISRSKVIIENSTVISTKPSIENIIPQKKPNEPVKTPCEVNEANLSLPELYSTLSISKKIDNVVKPKKVKSLSTVEKNVPLSEKAIKKLNFPHDRPVYKNLISLTVDKPETKPKPKHPRAARLPKYEDSTFSDILSPRQPAEYLYTSDSDIEIDPVLTTKDSLLLYRTYRRYDSSSDDRLV